MMSVLTAIGLSSARNGIHAAVLRTDGLQIAESGPRLFYPYDRDMKIFISRAVKAAQEGRDGASDIGKAAGEITAAHALAVERLLETADMTRKEIDVVGLHGHTILHRPARSSQEIGRSWQLGDGRTLSDDVKIDVVAGFRAADIAAGGQGRPLSPLLHWALAAQSGIDHALGVLELADAARCTYLAPHAREIDIVAYDCGPGLALLRDYLDKTSSGIIDPESAAPGAVHHETLRLFLLNPYLRRKPPKSLGAHVFKLDALLALSVADGAATLRALIAACASQSSRFFEQMPVEWIVTGEAAEDPLLLAALRTELGPAVATAMEAGWPGAETDALSHAYLAVRSLKKLPLTYPGTTRAPQPTLGGIYFRAPA